MPKFECNECNSDINISIDEFLSQLTINGVEKLISNLIDDGHIPSYLKNCILKKGRRNDFDISLEILHGKSHLLTIEEEETIKKIAEKFKYL